VSASGRIAGFVSDDPDRTWATTALDLSGAAAALGREPFISYPLADEVIAECEQRIVSAGVLAKPHLVLIGEPQNGKHAIIRWVARRHRPFRVRSADMPIVPLSVVEWPLGSDEWSLRDVLAHAVGILETTGWPDLAHAYREATVRLVVVRNTQELLDRTPQEQDVLWAQLMAFSDAAQVRLLLIGTPAVRALFDRQPRWLEPVHTITLPLWTPHTLVPFLHGLQRALDREAPDLAQHASLLAEATGGRLGFVVRAVRGALSQDGAVDDARVFAERVWRDARGGGDGL